MVLDMGDEWGCVDGREEMGMCVEVNRRVRRDVDVDVCRCEDVMQCSTYAEDNVSKWALLN
jgi:hypothetical protein